MKTAEVYRAERDMLAEAIRAAAVKVNLVRPDLPLSMPVLVMLCDNIASIARFYQMAAGSDLCNPDLVPPGDAFMDGH